MKKFLYFIVTFAIIITSSLSHATVYANDLSKTNSIYILSKKCPEEYKNYAYNNVRDFVLSVDPSEIDTLGKVSLGTPFSFANPDSDIFYFPVLINDRICFTLRVFQNSNGIYDGILSKAYVSELNSLIAKSSSKEPVILMMENDSVVTYIGENRTVIFEYPEGTVGRTSYIPLNQFSEKLFSKSSDYEVVNITTDTSDINFFLTNDILSSENNVQNRATPASKYLLTSIIETQDDNSWCSAYSTAWIVRYKKGDNTKAIDIMRYFYSNPSTSTALSEAEAVLYGNYKQLSPIYSYQPQSQAFLIAQIAANKPVYLTMRTPGTGTHSTHAVVLRGYNTNTNKWSIWNPWYDYYELLTMGSTYVPAEDLTKEYTYVRTIYNW